MLPCKTCLLVEKKMRESTESIHKDIYRVYSHEQKMNMNMNKKSSMIGDRSPRNALEWGDPVKRPDFYPEWLIWADPSKIPRLPDGWPMERGQWSDMMKRGIGKVRFSVSLCMSVCLCLSIWLCLSICLSLSVCLCLSV